jgi:hypothetical protein
MLTACQAKNLEARRALRARSGSANMLRRHSLWQREPVRGRGPRRRSAAGVLEHPRMGPVPGPGVLLSASVRQHPRCYRNETRSRRDTTRLRSHGAPDNLRYTP